MSPTHWKRLAAPMIIEEDIYITESGGQKRRVIVNSDGTVRAGCALIDKVTAQKIAKKILETK